jgi:hypothetical protein
MHLFPKKYLRNTTLVGWNLEVATESRGEEVGTIWL